jgi:hypothetical protein
MIEISFEVLLGLTQRVGAIYYYHSDHLRQTIEPHYFVVLAQSDSTIYVVPATSKIDKRKEWAEKSRIPRSTLIEVEPTLVNGLRKKSLFDCNSLFEETKESLKRKHQDTPIQVKGCMEEQTLMLLKAGVLLSPLVTREKKKFIEV